MSGKLVAQAGKKANSYRRKMIKSRRYKKIQRPPGKRMFRRSFQQTGRWQIAAAEYIEPGAAAERTVSWLRNYYVDTWLDGSNKVLFKVQNLIREKSSPFNFLYYGLLSFKKDEADDVLTIDYYINIEKPRAFLMFYPNILFAVHALKNIIAEGVMTIRK